MGIKKFNEWITESSHHLNEGEVSLSHQFALVFVGGSIGQRAEYPVFAKGQMGSIVETGDDKEVLKAEAARRRKNLSPGEKKYYGMSYTVIELTPSKIKDIQYLKNFQSKSDGEQTED